VSQREFLRLLTCFYSRSSYELPSNKAIADARSVYVDTVSTSTVCTFSLSIIAVNASTSESVHV
jgi:hypothetical protein